MHLAWVGAVELVVRGERLGGLGLPPEGLDGLEERAGLAALADPDLALVLRDARDDRAEAEAIGGLVLPEVAPV